jgi:hypothetical protein
VRKPTLVLSDIVGRTVAFISLRIRGSHRRHGRLACSVALSGQGPKPRSGAPKARDLTANARTELSSVGRDAHDDRTLSADSSTSLYSRWRRRGPRGSPENDFNIAPDELRDDLDRTLATSLQRYSIATVRPSIQPSSRSRCTKRDSLALNRGRGGGQDADGRQPSRLLCVRCARPGNGTPPPRRRGG